MRLRNDVYEVVAEGFRVPLLGVNVLNGNIYVSHKGVISVIKSDGTRQDIITGLPSNGDYGNSKVVFGHDGKCTLVKVLLLIQELLAWIILGFFNIHIFMIFLLRTLN